MGHVFFQNIGQRGQHTIAEDPIYKHNCMILEISSNLTFAVYLIDKYKDGKIKEVDELENDWLNFILKNNIEVEKYKTDSNKFIDQYLKK